MITLMKKVHQLSESRSSVGFLSYNAHHDCQLFCPARLLRTAVVPRVLMRVITPSIVLQGRSRHFALGQIVAFVWETLNKWNKTGCN